MQSGKCKYLEKVLTFENGNVSDSSDFDFMFSAGSCPSRHTFTGIDGLCFLNGGEGTRPEGVNYCTKMGSSLILVKSSNIENFLEKILGLYFLPLKICLIGV